MLLNMRFLSISYRRAFYARLLSVMAVSACFGQAQSAPIIYTETTYYDVDLKHARTTHSLHQILESNAPKDKEGKVKLEESGWNLDWKFKWQSTEQHCRVVDAKITLTKRSNLPRATRLPDEQKIRFAFTHFLKRVVNYHRERFRIMESGARDIEGALVGLNWKGDCENASKKISAVANEVYQATTERLGEYDRMHHYGYTGGYYFMRYPWSDGTQSPAIHADYEYFEFDLNRVNSKDDIHKQIFNYSTVARGDQKHEGSAQWIVFWDYDIQRQNGGCRLSNVRTSVEIVYTMPKALSLPQDPALVSYYEKIYQQLMEHEEMHATSGVAAANQIDQYLKSYTEEGRCQWLAKTVLAAANEIVDVHRARDTTFDAVTDHRGRRDEYVKLFGEQPWSTEGIR